MAIAESNRTTQGMESYFATHYGPRELFNTKVVPHWTGVPSTSSTWNTFAAATLGGRRTFGGWQRKCITFLGRKRWNHSSLAQRMPLQTVLVSIILPLVLRCRRNKRTATRGSGESECSIIQDLQTRHPIDLHCHHESLDFEHHPYFRTRSNLSFNKIGSGYGFHGSSANRADATTANACRRTGFTERLMGVQRSN